MIPVIDLHLDDVTSVSSFDFKNEAQIAKELCDAFKNVGFVYLKNFGISRATVSEYLKFLLSVVFRTDMT